MSAYVVSKKTIDIITTYMHGKRYQHIAGYYPAIADAYKSDATKLGQALWSMNVKAVDQRYEEKNPVNLYRYQVVPAHRMQVYKSLQGYLYQCAEGNVPESPLYKDVERMLHHIASDIISNLPAYEKADWA